MFDNMKEIVYAIDVNSYNVVYMNQWARDIYGVENVEKLSEKKCYELFHHCGEQCVTCNGTLLKKGEYVEGKIYDPILDRHFLVKDTIVTEADDDSLLHLRMMIEIGNHEHQVQTLERYQNMESLANEGLQLALQTSTPDESLQVALEYLGKALNAERTYIFEKREDGADDNTYEWVAARVTPQIDNLQNVAPEVCACWYDNFEKNKNIMIEDLENIKTKDPLMYDVLKVQDIHSLVVVPLYDGMEIIGFYGVDNPPAQSMEYASNILQIMGHFIVSGIRRRNLVQELAQMSYSDPLTTLGNRFAMDRYVTDHTPAQNVGVVFCDITGLKEVNDTKGHQAGDELIILASKTLQKVFRGYGLFRIGGDELLVICTDVSRDRLDQQIHELQQEILENHFHMAVGAVWREDGCMGLDWLLREAERRMYADKDEYYRASGARRRH